MNKHNFDYTELSISLPSVICYYVQKQASWGDLMRNSFENTLHIYRRPTMQKCDFNKVALHHLLLKPGARPWTWAVDPDPEKPRPWKTWLMKNVGNSSMQKKDWKTTYSIIYYNIKIPQEEILKQAIWRNSNWGFLGTQEMCLRSQSTLKKWKLSKQLFADSRCCYSTIMKGKWFF